MVTCGDFGREFAFDVLGVIFKFLRAMGGKQRQLLLLHDAKRLTSPTRMKPSLLLQQVQVVYLCFQCVPSALQ